MKSITKQLSQFIPTHCIINSTRPIIGGLDDCHKLLLDANTVKSLLSRAEGRKDESVKVMHFNYVYSNGIIVMSLECWRVYDEVVCCSLEWLRGNEHCTIGRCCHVLSQ